MSKIIIGIHGLGNKPPKKILSDWWKSAIAEGLRTRGYAAREFEFKLVYWADILHPVPIEQEDVLNKNWLYVPEVYPPEILSCTTETMERRRKALDSLAKYYGKIWADGLLQLNKPTLTDLFVHLHLRDLEIYYSRGANNQHADTNTARQSIIGRVRAILNQHKDKDVLIIAHSMGSIILHDALCTMTNGFSANTLVTIGSPLAQHYVINKMHEESKQSGINKLSVPESIHNKWFNLSDPEDKIAINNRLHDFYTPNRKGVMIDDREVFNNYMSYGLRNPHSSFGYLRTKEMAEIINAFLTYKTPGIFTRFWKKFLKQQNNPVQIF